jgi:hypothetical protein
MANTKITLFNDKGAYVPSVPSVPVVAGDIVSFATSDGSATELFFSPAAASVLSPTPASPFKLAAKENAAFKFTSSAHGAYSVFTNSAPQRFPGYVSQVLSLEVGPVVVPPNFGGPHDTINPGS